MQAGEPLANDAPIMIATARIGIKDRDNAYCHCQSLFDLYRFFDEKVASKRSPVLPVNTCE
jgi:hypothetical protein